MVEKIASSDQDVIINPIKYKFKPKRKMFKQAGGYVLKLAV